jgi:murein DD-endopeptidase MepM/ murein hydrolase activator NlpD
MTRTLPFPRSAIAVLVLVTSLVVAPPASARSDAGARLQMTWPANGTVTARFGEWRGSHRHNGIDIGMLRSPQLRSVLAGTVEETGYASGYGNIVVLDLPGPYTALYAHLSSVRVHPGQHVRKGQRIGLAGCTGSCSGTHLHFEVTWRGAPVDPLRFLR